MGNERGGYRGRGEWECGECVPKDSPVLGLSEVEGERVDPKTVFTGLGLTSHFFRDVPVVGALTEKMDALT